MKSEGLRAQAVEVKGYVPPLSGKVSGAVESYAPAASTGNMDHFASTAGSFKGKDRDFKSMGASSGPDWLSGSAAPRPPPAAAVASPAASTGNMDHFAPTAGSFKGKDRDFKSMGASSGPDWLSGSAAPGRRPRGRGRRPRRARSRARTATSSPWAPRPAPTGSPARPPRGRRPAAAVASPAASTGNMDHFAPTAGSFKGKDRDFKSMGASSGPDWLSGSAAPAAAAPAAAVASPAASTGNMDHFASTAGSFKGKDRDFKSMGASSGPDWLSGSAAPAAAAPAAAVASPAASTGNMDHFASTAGSFKGKDRDFKSMGASSGPDWLSGSAAPAAPAAAAAVASPAASTGNMDHFVHGGLGKDRDFKSMGASSGPDWLSGSAAPAAAAPAAAVASPAASTGNMDHFASTAGSFKGKDRDFKSMGAASGPDWLSGSAAPAAAVASPAASTGNMDHFAHGGLGKDRDFKSMGASSGPDWLSGSAAPAAAAPATAVASPAASTGNMDHFASTAGSFKGKDRDFKSMGASSGPDWLSGSAAPRPPPRGRGRGKDRDFKSMGASSGPDWLSGSAAPRPPPRDRGRVPGGLHGQHGPLRPTAGSFKGKDRDFKSMGASSGPDWLSGSAAPRPPPRGRGRVPGGLHGQHGPLRPTAGSFKGKDRDFKSMGASSGPDWLSGSAAPRPPPRDRGRVPGGLHGQHGPLRPRRARSRARTATSSPWAPRPAPTGSLARPPPRPPPRGRGRVPGGLHGQHGPLRPTAGSFKGKDRDFKSMGASSGPDWLSGSAAPRPRGRGRGRVPGGLHGQHGPLRPTAGSFKGKDRDFKSMGASSGPDWLSGSAAPAAAAPAAAVASPAASTGNMDHFASTAGSFKGKDRDFKSMGASSGPDWLSGSAASAAAAPAAAVASPAASTGNMDHFASTAGSFKGKDRDFKSMGASSGPDWLSGSAAPRSPPRGRATSMAWLRLCALSAGVAAFQNNAPTTKRALEGLRAAWLEEQQFVAGLDGQSNDEAEVAVRAALDAIRADGRLVNDKEAEQAAWEAAWIAVKVANLERLKNEKNFAAAKAAEDVKGYVPPLGGRAAGQRRRLGEQSAAEQALASMEQERVAAAAPAAAAASGSMDHFASTAGSFKGKDRDFKAMGAASGPEWLSGSAAPAAAPAATAAPAKAASTGNMDHFASTAGSFKGKDRDFKSMGAASAPSGSPAPPPCGRRPAAASPAASTGNMDHFASTAGSFKGKDRDFKAMGAASGPEWLSGSAAPAAAAPAAASPAASTGNMDHFASTAGSFKGKDRDFKAMGAASGPEWLSGSAALRPSPCCRGKDRDFKAMGASSGPDWLAGTPFATAAPVAPAAAPAKAAASGNMDHFAPTAGSFKGKDRDFKSMGAASGPEWLSGSAAASSAPPATAAPAKAASGSMDHFASTAGSFKGKDRDFKSMGAASGPDGSPAPPPCGRRPAAASPAASTGSMDHFASTAGSFKGKDRDFKSMGAASGPEWLFGSAAPAAAAPAASSPAASTGNMDHFGPRRARSRARTATSRPWAPRPAPSGSPARPPRGRRPAAAAPAASTGNMDHFAPTAGSFKGKDRDFKSMGASSGPDWLSGSAAPAAAAPAAAVASPAASTGNMDHFASTAGSFKGKDRDFKSMGAASGPDWLSGSAAPRPPPRRPRPRPPRPARWTTSPTAGSFKGKDRDFKSMGAASGPEWLSGSAAASSAAPAAAAPRGRGSPRRCSPRARLPPWLAGARPRDAAPDAAWLDRDALAPAVASVEPVKAASLDFETSEAELEARAAAAALRSEARRVGRASREAAWVAATGTNLKRLENAKAYVSPLSERVAYVPPLAGALDEVAADPLDERSAPRDGGGLGLTSLQRQRVAEEEANGAAQQKTAELGLASLQRQRVADEEAGGTARQKAAALGLASLQRQRVAEEEANGAAQQKTAELGLASLQRQRAEEEANGAARQKTAEPGLASLQRQRVAEEEVKQTAQQKTTEPGLQRQRVAEEEAKRIVEEGAGQLDEFVADEPAIIVEDAADEPAIVVEDPLDKRAPPLGDGGLGGILAQKAAELGLASLQRQRVAEEEAAKLKAEQKALLELEAEKRVAEEQAAQLKAEQEAPLPAEVDTRSLRAEGQRVLESNLERLRVAEQEAAQLLAAEEGQRVRRAEPSSARAAEAEAARLKAEQESLFAGEEERRALRAEGMRSLEGEWTEQAEREAAWTAASVASLERVRVAEAEAARVAEAEAAQLEAEREALFEQQRVTEEQAVTTEQEAPLPAKVDTRSLRAEGERVLESEWAEQASREAAWTAASVASLERVRVAEAEASAAEEEVVTTEQEAPLPAKVDTRSLRAEGQRVLESKWAEQASREAAWTAASVASLERVRVAEEEAVMTEQEAPLPAEVGTRSLRAEVQRVLESKWAEQAELEAAWTAASVANLEQLRVAEAEAVATEQEAPPDWLSGSAAASSAAPAEVDTRSLRAEGERVLESKWAEQAELEAAWTAASVANLEQLRVAEAEAFATEQEAPPDWLSGSAAASPAAPAEVDTRSLRAEGERVLESKWAEQAEREAAWTAASVANLEQLRVAEAEAFATEQEAPPTGSPARRRPEGERVLESKWAEQAEREAAWTAASAANLEQLRVAEEEAVTTEQEAPLPAEVDTRSLRAEGQRVLESKGAEQAEREAAWFAAYVASLEQLRVSDEEAPQLFPAEEKRLSLRADAWRRVVRAGGARSRLDRGVRREPRAVRVAEAEAARLKAEQEALFAGEEERRALRAEGMRSLEGEWTEQAEREAAWTAASVASLERVRVAEAEAARLKAEQEALFAGEEERRAPSRGHAQLGASGPSRRSAKPPGPRRPSRASSGLEGEWSEQAEREAAWTAASVASLERVRVAEAEAARSPSKRRSSPARRAARSSRGYAQLEGRWSEQAEREAAWTAASVASLERVRVAEAEAARLKAEQEALFAGEEERRAPSRGHAQLEASGPSRRSAKPPGPRRPSRASSGRVAEAEAARLKAEQEALFAGEEERRAPSRGHAQLEGEWSEQAEREAAWTAASVASLERVRVAEAEAARLKAEQEALFAGEEERRALRAEGMRSLEGEWSEQAEREAAWTAASVASLERVRVAEAEAARVAEAEAAQLEAEREVLFEQQRVAEEQAVTTEQEAPLPAKLKAEDDDLSASVASRKGPRVAKAEAPQLKTEQEEASLSVAERARARRQARRG
ncbi:ATPase [Aureococcus anophagefferens]|nr:ATPase [Aureococcus anophagefferens]